jgi:predicted RNA-binding protein
MCLASVYVEKDGQKEEIMRDVAWVEPRSQGLQLPTLLGESRLFQARIRSIDLVHNSIVLESMTTSPSGNRAQTEGERDDSGDPP